MLDWVSILKHMNPKDIKVGVTYHNRGAGRTKRTVIKIFNPGPGELPPWFSINPRPNEPAVVFTYARNGSGTMLATESMLYLSSFASWAGGVA